MANPFFTVVIPLYNKSATIAQTLSSVLAQTDISFEVIVVDDGSTDFGHTIVQTFHDERVRLIRQENAGPGAARNAGIAAAHGEWIAFLDADDLIATNHLSELGRIADRYPKAGLIGTAFKEVHGAEVDLQAQKEGRICPVDFFNVVASGQNPLCSSSAAIRSSVPETIGGFSNAKLGEDREYWARAALSFAVVTSDATTCYYRKDVAGTTASSARRWQGKQLRRAGDIAPAAAVAEAAISDPAHTQKSASLGRFIDTYIGYCLHASVVAGDVATIRQLPTLYKYGPEPQDLIWLRAARLPLPFAKAAIAYVRAVRSLGSRCTRLLRHG